MKKGKFRTALLSLLFLASIGAHVFINTAPPNGAGLQSKANQEITANCDEEKEDLKAKSFLPDVEVLRKLIDRARVDIPVIPFINF